MAWRRPAPGRLFDASGRLVMAAAILIATVQIFWFAQTQRQGYEQAVARVERDTRNVAHLLAEHAARTFDAVGETLRAVGRLRADVARGIYRSQASIHVNLRTLHGGSPLLDEIGWFDAYGERIASSQMIDPPRISVAGQEMFRVHLDATGNEVHVSRPIRSTDGTNWQIEFSRRIEALDGSFAGIAHGSLNAARFAEAYRALDLGPGHEISLLRRDGVVLVRTPEESLLLGQQVDHGIVPRAQHAQAAPQTYHDNSHGNRGGIIGSHADVPRSGGQLVVDVSLSRDAALAEYWQSFMHDAGELIVALFALMIGGAFLAISLQRRERLSSDLAAATAATTAAEASAARVAASEAALQRALLAERAMSAQQRRFIAIASHEFRTPLTIIDGAAQRLRHHIGGAATDDVTKRLERIRGAVARITDIIERTLSSARVDEGRMEFHPKALDLDMLVRTACEQSRNLNPDFEFRLRGPSEPLMIIGDPALLDQAISNLLSNAVKFSRATRRVEITVGANDAGPMITVRDFGVGIPDDEMSMLFTRYFRARTAGTVSGVGIGLFLVREIVALHGGTITVTSALGSGSTFTIHLPHAVSGAGAQPAQPLRRAGAE